MLSCSNDLLDYYIIIIILLLLLVNVWFWILFVTEFKLLDSSGDCHTCKQCNVTASLCISIYIIFFTYFFLIILHRYVREWSVLLVCLGMSAQMPWSNIMGCSGKLLGARCRGAFLCTLKTSEHPSVGLCLIILIVSPKWSFLRFLAFIFLAESKWWQGHLGTRGLVLSVLCVLVIKRRSVPKVTHRCRLRSSCFRATWKSAESPTLLPSWSGGERGEPASCGRAALWAWLLGGQREDSRHAGRGLCERRLSRSYAGFRPSTVSCTTGRAGSFLPLIISIVLVCEFVDVSSTIVFNMIYVFLFI